ncbi:NAD(P)-dependent oxidoreductase [Pseudactinotalea sp. Z1732]|uniref:NAD(P)-dependent oxidoreductase n=1 Tax=Micrococcales TaxID=85006 RepID=UPI003C79B871
MGGTGSAGSRIAREALERGHGLTIASRSGRPGEFGGHERVETVRLDSADVDAVASRAEGHDVVVGATRPAAGMEGDIIDLTHGLATGIRHAGSRLLVVGGAAPLRLPGSGRRVLDDPHWVSSEFRAVAIASNRQLEVLSEYTDVTWTYLAPAAHFAPGSRTGRYTLAEAELVIAPDGASVISMEDYALALVDLAERPTDLHKVLAVGPG